MEIALDAMGGDHAPGPIVAGAVQAVAANPDLHVVLVGDRAQVEPHLGGASERIEIFHCTQVITMEETPVLALRKKPDNSISRCWQLLAERKVEAIVSAGNTGAMVAGGFRLKLFLKNVRRPGIAAVMPTLKGPCVLLDVGANVSPKPEHLFQYGVMGSIFAKHILQRPDPKIGLMNTGSEEAKGHDLAKDTHALFNASALKDSFIGNVEEAVLQGAGVEEGVRVLGQVMALGFLGAGVHEPDLGIGPLQDVLGEDGAHDAVLKEMLRLGADVGADVEQHARALERGHDGGDAGAAHVLEEKLEAEAARDHGPGVARADDCLDLALGQQLPAAADGVVRLLAQ